jgi:ComF family protein
MALHAQHARAALRNVIDFALPPRCGACGSITAAQGTFCLECWEKLELLGPPCCACCALPFDYESEGEPICAGCLVNPPAFDRMRAAVAYGPLARDVALKLKYGRRPGMAQTMAGLMARHLTAFDDPILCPVPLHRWRIWHRGYNQSALIGRALARRPGLPFLPDLLLRIRATPPLKGMSPAERERTVRGAFRLNPRYRQVISGRNILIIDDVFTSGATANACARLLKKEGAAGVGLLCWARVVRDRDH